MSATALTSATRSALGLMVDKEAHRAGSRTVAYDRVASTIGASSSWLKKFLADTGEVSEPRIHLFLRIKEAYISACERIEADNRGDEARLRDLRGRLNEIISGFDAESHHQVKAGLGKGD